MFGLPLCLFNFKSFKYRLSLSFIRFQCVLHDSAVLFSESWNFHKLKRGRSHFWGEPILQKVWITWYPFLDFNFKSFMVPYFSSFIWFQCIVHDPGLLSAEFWNFYELKSSDLISGENQFCRMSELFVPSFCISILKVLQAKIFHLSWDFNTFCMIQEYCSHSFRISTN